MYCNIGILINISCTWSRLIRYQSQNGNVFTRKCHRCHTLNAPQINFPSYGIDLEYLWQTEC